MLICAQDWSAQIVFYVTWGRGMMKKFIYAVVVVFAIMPVWTAVAGGCGCPSNVWHHNSYFQGRGSNEFIFSNEAVYEEADELAGGWDAVNPVNQSDNLTKGMVYECDNECCNDNELLFLESGHVFEKKVASEFTVYTCLVEDDGDLWVPLHTGDVADIKPCSEFEYTDSWESKKHQGVEYKYVANEIGGNICVDDDTKVSDDGNGDDASDDTKVSDDGNGDDASDSSSDDVAPRNAEQCKKAIYPELVQLALGKLKKSVGKISITASEMAKIFKNNQNHCEDYVKSHKDKTKKMTIKEANFGVSMKQINKSLNW